MRVLQREFVWHATGTFWNVWVAFGSSSTKENRERKKERLVVLGAIGKPWRRLLPSMRTFSSWCRWSSTRTLASLLWPNHCVEKILWTHTLNNPSIASCGLCNGDRNHTPFWPLESCRPGSIPTRRFSWESWSPMLQMPWIRSVMSPSLILTRSRHGFPDPDLFFPEVWWEILTPTNLLAKIGDTYTH